MLANNAIADTDNNRVQSQYKKHTQNFADYLRTEYKIRETKDMPADKEEKINLINNFVEKLKSEGKSAATIHTYIAPVCKGLGVNMREIEKPKRMAIEVEKGRMPDIKNQRGQEEKKDPRYARLVDAAERIGIRRAEYGRLSGYSLSRDCCGHLCVVVKGKGGKVQHQRILPADEQATKKLFENCVNTNKKIFEKADLANKIDLHTIRREHAQKAYKYYCNLIKSGKGEELKADLLKTFSSYHHHGDDKKQISRFLAQIERSGGEYLLRGQNIDRARIQGSETKFDRLALMCVSVWHLAHWRLDVTVRHYML